MRCKLRLLSFVLNKVYKHKCLNAVDRYYNKNIPWKNIIYKLIIYENKSIFNIKNSDNIIRIYNLKYKRKLYQEN
ncbi:MAG TPA: hypothetical protein DCL50_10720 [Methylococcaceae bacterium]|nr:hypothetical protein [Methylococcaceae bacterium]